MPQEVEHAARLEQTDNRLLHPLPVRDLRAEPAVLVRGHGAEIRLGRSQRIAGCGMHREVAPLGKLLAARAGHAVAGHTAVAGHGEKICCPQARHLRLVEREVADAFHPVGVLLCPLLRLEGHQRDAVHEAHEVGLHEVAALHPILPGHAEVVLPHVLEIHELQRAVVAVDRERHALAQQVEKLLVRLDRDRAVEGALEDVHSPLRRVEAHAVDVRHPLDEDAFDERIGKRAGVSLELLVGARLPAQLAQPVEDGNLDTLFFGDFAHGFCSTSNRLV